MNTILDALRLDNDSVPTSPRKRKKITSSPKNIGTLSLDGFSKDMKKIYKLENLITLEKEA